MKTQNTLLLIYFFKKSGNTEKEVLKTEKNLIMKDWKEIRKSTL